MIYEGNIAVKAAVLSPYCKVEKIWIASNNKNRDTKFIFHRAQEADIPVEFVTRDTIDHLATGTTHGGIVAEVAGRCYQSIADILKPNAFIALVEGVEDPYNFGYILRSLYAAGCDGVITNTRNWSNAANVVAKASAGASEYIPHIVSENIPETLQALKQHNIQIVSALRDDDAIEMYEFNFNQAICICIGGEKRGLSKDVIALSDQHVYIPYNANFRNALSATSATTILAYEVVRQRKQS